MLHDGIFTPLLSVDPATPTRRGVPWNVLAAGRYKIRPLLRKQPGMALTPLMDGVSRQVTRRLLREMHKGSKPPQASRAAIRRRRAL